MKLEKGKVYKVEFNTEYGVETFYGEYMGIAVDEHSSLPCLICRADNHRRGHQFNSFYEDNDFSYETFNIGTSCINKCMITESTREEMLNN